MVLALERESNKEFRCKLNCCSAYSIGQRCTNLIDSFKPPPQLQEQDANSDETPTPSDSPVSSWTRKKFATTALEAPLREAVRLDGGTMLIKIPFSTIDLDAWKKVAREYRVDPVGVAKHFKFIMKQHNPDWNDIQLLLEYVTDTEEQLILKTAGNLAEDHYKTAEGDVKDYFHLQDPKWDANRSAHMERLQAYQEWIFKGMERAIPRTIN